jgi:methylmalonyl-CoA/ethylmalonyl-CoA epimerase
MRRIHHVGVVVKRLTDAYRFYRDVLGLPLLKEQTIAAQGVRAALLAAGDTEIELLEPLDAASGIKDLGAELIDTAPREGLAGRIAFLHPRTCCGVLVELATPPAGEPPSHASPLGLKRLVIGAKDVKQTAGRFQALFGFSEVALNDGPRTMLAVGKGALLVVPAAEVGGSEGMVALSLVAEDFAELTAALRRASTPRLEGTAEVSVEPAGSHGVHLHISRYNFP